MTTSSRDLAAAKANALESYGNFDEGQEARINAATSLSEFDATMYNVVEEQNIKHFIEVEGLDRGAALKKARSYRKKAGG